MGGGRVIYMQLVWYAFWTCGECRYPWAFADSELLSHVWDGVGPWQA